MRWKLAPVRVRLDSDGWWIGVCRVCPETFWGSDGWFSTMEWVLGHLSMKHPQWPQVDIRDGSN